MNPSESTFAALETRGVAELRAEWERLHGVPPPKGLGRNLMIRAIAWKQQERVHGGLPQALAKELRRLAAQLERSGELDVERELSLKAGTRLVREWNGRTYSVTVLEKGYQLEDRRYGSLSQIARAVTGSNWSGPRFFGLRQRSKADRGSRVDG